MIITAFFIGLLFSVPVGSLGMIMLKRSVDKGFWEGFSIAIIDSIAGFIFSLLFLMGIGQVDFDPAIKLVAQIFGLLFLLIIGLKEIFFKNKEKNKLNLNKGSNLGNLFLVFGYYVSNPTIWAFWLNVSVFINSNFIHQNTLANYALFSLFYASGALICQYLSIQLIKNLDQFEKVKSLIQPASSALFVITLSYFFFTTIQSIGLQWNALAHIFQ